jgi:hypothetical protein
VLSVHNDLVCSIDRGEVSALVLLDLSSAFDTVDHNILLSILSDRFSLSDSVLHWFHSYLSDRTQSFTFACLQTATFPVDCSVPQGSVLGPLEFIAYTEDVTQLLDGQGVEHHLYADDMQLYASDKPSGVDNIRLRLNRCAERIMSWCASRRLQLNGSKSEIAWFGSHANLKKLAGQDLTLSIGPDVIQPNDAVRDLGVWLDSELTLRHHITKVATACYYHLRRLRQIRRRVGQDITARLVVALILSRLDYCNSVLAGLPGCTTSPLQRVQNSAARLVFSLRPCDHVTPALIQLHWLPVQSRIEFKLCTIMYCIKSGLCPSYLARTVQPTSTRSTRSGLRSANSTDFFVPRLRTSFGERAFSFSGPRAWNSLPETIRSASSIATFKRHLKTHLFKSAFSLC